MLDPELYRTVLETLATGVYVVDRDRRILMWNDGAERITGFHRHEVIGRRCQDDMLMHCDSQRNVLCGSGCPLTATMHDGHAREADVLLRHKNGERVPVRVRAVPLRDENGTIIGAVESFDEPFAGVEASPSPGETAVADRDELTGLHSRSSIAVHLDAALNEFHLRQIPCAVLCLEIDRLEAFQHAYGPLAAEALIRSAAHTLSRSLHPGDVVGRWSGNRFVVVLGDCPLPAADATAGRLQRTVSLAAISWWGDRLSSTISAGGAVARPDDTARSWLGRAEEALARCIHEGGDRAAFGPDPGGTSPH
jgi:diguanylate cyclase (GGDEF)-like protein/PAS domain S-box-containing protein